MREKCRSAAKLMARGTGDASICRAALTAGVLGLTALVAAAPARADTDSYLAKVHNLGVSTPGGDLELNEWGWEVCVLFAHGVAPGKVRDQAVYNSGSHPQYGMTVEQADAIVRIAVTDLCSTPGQD
jgi:hypothetical protein